MYFIYSAQERKRTSRSNRWASISPNTLNSEESNPKIGVSLKNLTKVYSIGKNEERKAVNNLTLDFMMGDVTALLGHNGAGKSTMM